MYGYQRQLCIGGFVVFITLNRLVFTAISFTGAFAYCGDDFTSCISDGKIKYVESGNIHYETSNYCTNSTGTTLISAKCAKDKNCLILLPTIRLDPKDLQFQSGKPGFELCRKLGGRGQIVEFEAHNAWQKLDRCSFSSDSWYIDTGFLLGYYIKKQSR